MKITVIQKLILLLSLSATTAALYAQQETPQLPFILGKTEILPSDILGEERVLNIYLPVGYAEQDSLQYPVLYVLDGSANEDFIHIAGLVQFLCMYRLMPPSIVVGISNVDRKRDFTFPTAIPELKKDFPTTGGSEKFIAFLEQELQPFIQKNYRTNTSKTILGQSLGGLLATEILYKKPALFNTYLIISPSLWWDNGSLCSLQQQAIQQPTTVFVGVGEEGKVMKRGAKRLARLLKTSKNPKIHSHFEYFPKENHATVLHQAVYSAFRTIYRDAYPGL